MGKDESIDLGLKNIWQSWFHFRTGKRKTRELRGFRYALEENLYQLHQKLNAGTYKHGKYKVFETCDNKKRTISVASVRNRVVHRLICDFLVPIYDPTFIYDAWSCRKGKGRVRSKLNERNVSSYRGMVQKHEHKREMNKFEWHVLEKVMNG